MEFRDYCEKVQDSVDGVTRGMFSRNQCVRFMKIVEGKFPDVFPPEKKHDFHALSDLLKEDPAIIQLKEEFVDDYGEALEDFWEYSKGLLPRYIRDSEDLEGAYEEFLHEGFLYCMVNDIVTKAMHTASAVLN